MLYFYFQFDVREAAGILISSTILTLTFVIPMQSLHKVFTFSSKKEEQEENNEKEGESEPEKIEEPEVDIQEKEEEEEEIIEVPQTRSRHFMAHREVLEEIPEVEVEYETQREKDDGLDEILEEEEDEAAEEEMENHIDDDDDLEIIEEEQEQEQGGEDDFWADREEYIPRRAYPREEDQEVDEWEWTANGNGSSGAQYFRYTR